MSELSDIFNIDPDLDLQTLEPNSETQAVYQQYNEFFEMADRLIFEYSCRDKDFLRKIRSGTSLLNPKIQSAIESILYRYFTILCINRYRFLQSGMLHLNKLIPRLFSGEERALAFVSTLLEKSISAWQTFLQLEPLLGNLIVDKAHIQSEEFTLKYRKEVGGTGTITAGEIREVMDAQIVTSKKQLQIMVCELVASLNSALETNQGSPGYGRVCEILTNNTDQFVPLLDKHWDINHQNSDPRSCWIYLAACACYGCFRSLRKAAQQLPEAGINVYLETQSSESADFYVPMYHALQVLRVCKRFCHHTHRCSLDSGNGWLILRDNYLAWQEVYQKLEQHWSEVCNKRQQPEVGCGSGWYVDKFDTEKQKEGIKILADIQEVITSFENDFKRRMTQYETRTKIEIKAWQGELGVKSLTTKENELAEVEKNRQAYFGSLSKSAKKKRRQTIKPDSVTLPDSSTPLSEIPEAFLKSSTSLSESPIELGLKCLEQGRGEDAEQYFLQVVHQKQPSSVAKAWALLFLGNLALKGCPSNIKACYQHWEDIVTYHTAINYCLDEK